MEQAQERRVHPRYHVGECGYLEPKGNDAHGGKQEVYVADISRGGLGLHLDRALPAGTTVRVTLSRCTIEGVVAHCRMNEVGYIAGIKAHKSVDHVEKLRAPASRAREPLPQPPLQAKQKLQAAPALDPPQAEYRTTERVTFLGIRIRRRSPAKGLAAPADTL